MPITSHYSYKEVLMSFMAHWKAHEELEDMVLVLGVTREGLETLLTSLTGALAAVGDAESELSRASKEADWLKRQLGKRLVEFNAAARQWLEGLPEGELVPQAESFTTAPDKFCRPVREALRLWQVVNAGPPPEGLVLPLVLRGGFTRADLEGLRAEFDAARLAEEDAEFALGLARARRDVVETRVRRVLASYNGMVTSQFGEDSSVAETKPRLFPLPGSTPDAVTLTGAWSTEKNGAALAWEASTDAKVTGYQLRCLPGPVYQRRGSKVLRNFKPDDPREYLGREPLSTPGGVVSYCVYVIKPRGRHKASKPVAIAMPGAGGGS